ncbi:MAG: ATP-dependent Clp protease proteolytic subunit [Oscillospiraceae bacterium]|nr:ATP-dependent Clp protease proteolytic subunit [Oscillospiraceae bacterium]
MHMEEVRELGTARQGSIHCLTIIGQIEGHQILPDDVKTTKYEHLLPTIAAIEESPEVTALLILLNTAGGDVEAGLAIAEMIAGMRKPTASLVLGGGHSIGVPLAVSAGRSFIAPSASMTIHPVRITGVVIGAAQTYDYLARMQERITAFVTAHSRITERRYTSLMSDTSQLANDVGSILSGQEAVAEGLIDSIGTLSDALAYLHGCADND